jgi:hypothetical protein
MHLRRNPLPGTHAPMTKSASARQSDVYDADPPWRCDPFTSWLGPLHSQRFDQPVVDTLQCGLSSRNTLRHSHLDDRPDRWCRKLLIRLSLWVWLAALDDFRN